MTSSSLESTVPAPPGQLVTFSEEVAEVPRQQHGLLEEDLPVGDAERTIHAPQDVAPRADPRVLFGAQPRPVDVEVRFDLQLVAVVGDDADVRDQVPSP